MVVAIPTRSYPKGAFQRDVGYVSGAVMAVERTLFEDLAALTIFSPQPISKTPIYVCVAIRQAAACVPAPGERDTFRERDKPHCDRRSRLSSIVNRERFLDRHRAWLFPQTGVPPRFGRPNTRRMGA